MKKRPSYTPQQLQKQFRRYPMVVLLLTIIAAMVFYYTLEQYTPNQETVTVAVLTTSVDARHSISKDDFTWEKTDVSLIPETAFTEKDGDPAGFVTLLPIDKGTLLTQTLLVNNTNPDSISTVLTDGLAFRLPVDWFQNGLPEVAIKDTIDIFISAPGTTLEDTRLLADTIEVIDIEEGKSKTEAIIVQIPRKRAAEISAAHANQLAMTVAIHPVAKVE